MGISPDKKKNCENCTELEWVDGEAYDESGFTCNKRLANEYNQEKETRLLEKLDSEKYRLKSKVCFEGKL